MSEEQDKKNSDDKKTDEKGGGYSFFVDQPGNESYSYGVSGSITPPSWFNDLTSGNSSLDTLGQFQSAPTNVDLSQSSAQNSTQPSVSSASHQSDLSQSTGNVANDSYSYSVQNHKQDQVQSLSPSIPPAPAPVSVYVPAPTPAPAPVSLPKTQPSAESRQVFEQKAELEYLSLNLSADKRFANLHLASELAATVDRIYSLVDLDFNGFVDFAEIARVLQGDHLSESEKGFVKLINSLASKILLERPSLAEYYVPVLSRDDFRLAFAYQCASIMGKDAQSKGILNDGPKKSGKVSLFADNDDPLASLRPEAAKWSTFGDAYFVAALAALVAVRPRAVLRMLHVTAAKTYEVSFGVYEKPLMVMPPRPEDIVNYGLADRYGFWFPLLEKAYGIYIAQRHQMAGKLGSARSESLNMAQQAFETLTRGQVEVTVVADLVAGGNQGLLEFLANLNKYQRPAIAISQEGISESMSHGGGAPLSKRPYPIIAVSRGDETVTLGTIYSDSRDLNSSGLVYSMDDFRRYFKVILAEDEERPPLQGENHWKKMVKGPKF